MVTPKRPEATCLIAERRESPLSSGVQRAASSPPSPVFDLPPMRFIAMASDSCDSAEIEPKLIAPVTKRLTISLASSTSSKGTDLLGLKAIRPRRVQLRVPSLLDFSANSQ